MTLELYKIQLKQLNQLSEQLEARATRGTNIVCSNEWKQQQTRRSYQSEYDRTRSHVANGITPSETKVNK
jgi:phosphohistidine phosphatase SixA